jgi:hypothetical protein
VLGRFVTVDPQQSLTDPLQWNPYLYANNSPVTKADPTGLMTPPDDGPNPRPGYGGGRGGGNGNGSSKQSPHHSGGGRTAPVQHGPSAPIIPGDFFAGAGWALWDNLAGLGQAALDAFTDPVGIRRASQLAQALATNGVDGTAAKVWDGITKPYTSRWNSGDQAGAIGYGVVEIAITLAGTKGATKLATATKIETSIAAETADGAANVANGVRLRAQLTGEQISGGHAFADHVVKAGEFPGITTRQDFASRIEDVVTNGESRQLLRERTAYWEGNTVVIRDPASVDGGTAFVPTGGYNYFLGLK